MKILRILFLSTLVLSLAWIARSFTQDLPRIHQQDEPPGVSETRCLECHSEYRARVVKFPHEAFVSSSCLRCHAEHENRGKPVEGRRIQHKPAVEDIDLCYECHKKSDLGRSHPVGKKVVDRRTGEMITCTSACHDPHGSNHEDLLKKDGKRELCVGCHQDFERRLRKKRRRRFRFF